MSSITPVESMTLPRSGASSLSASLLPIRKFCVTKARISCSISVVCTVYGPHGFDLFAETRTLSEKSELGYLGFLRFFLRVHEEVMFASQVYAGVQLNWSRLTVSQSQVFGDCHEMDLH